MKKLLLKIFLGALLLALPLSGLAAVQFEVDTGGTLTTGLVGYWKMDGDSTDFFASADGTDSSVTYSSTTPKIGEYGVYNAGATTYTNITIPTSTDAFSVSFWAKFDAFSSIGGVVTAQVSGSPNAGGWIAIYTNASGELTTFARSGSSDFVNEATGDTLSTGTWYHVVQTWDSAGDGKVRVYIDGASPFVSTGSSTTSMAGIPPMGFGGLQWANGSYDSWVNDGNQTSDVNVDEVGYWSKALSSTEVADLYNSGSGQTMVEAPSGPANLKTYNAITKANWKTKQGISKSNIKTKNTIE